MRRFLSLETFAAGLLLALAAPAAATPPPADPAARVTLAAPPHWATAARSAGPVPAATRLPGLSLTLARSPRQQLAFEAFLRAQQDPASPDYRNWLSSEEIGRRFGPDEAVIDDIRDWLLENGLEPESLSADRRRLRFAGAAADVAAAFGTQLELFMLADGAHMAPKSTPSIPARISRHVSAVAGLDLLPPRPLGHWSRAALAEPEKRAPQPAYTGGDGRHFLFPGDFAKIYSLQAPYARGIRGTGQTIAIIGRTRVHEPDITAFGSFSGVALPRVQTVIPHEGVDPGRATGKCGDGCDQDDEALMDQMEITMDLQRAGSTAPGAKLKLVTSGRVDRNDGVYIALEHALTADPPPAHIVSMSYGTCEADNSAGAATWLNSIYETAAAKGISVFVSSGDAGAIDCTPHHEPPAEDRRMSTNLLCTSPHVTCVGGTQFADEDAPARWWLPAGGSYTTARGYIPEGAWNEPLNPDGQAQVAATGGGNSQFYPRPYWQTGPGIAATSRRIVPDVSFSASSKNGYLTCMAAYGGACVPDAEGLTYFLLGAGTSASAPGMAGVAALLHQSAGAPQGNLNPGLYQLARGGSGGIFNDVTVASSGVRDCRLAVPSLCNNTVPGARGSNDSMQGYAVTPGHDRATGLGSLNVANLLNAWGSLERSSVNLNQQGLSGSWANLASDSQGIVLDSTPDLRGPGTGVFFGGWFTWTDQGQSALRWYTLQGDVTDTAASAPLRIYATTGGRLASPQATVTEEAGFASLLFPDCLHAQLDYIFHDGRSGSIPLERMLPNVSCSTAGNPGHNDAVLSGAWADVATDGQGLVLEVNPDRTLLFGAWYTFAANGAPGAGAGSQRWYTLQGPYQQGQRKTRGTPIYESAGGRFDRAANTTLRQVGEADLDLGCSQGRLHWRFTAGELAGRSGSMELTRMTGAAPDCLP